MEDLKTILIHTFADDEHAKVINYALRTRGHKVVLWCGEDIPLHAIANFEFDTGKNRVSFKNKSGQLQPSDVDVVWNRRRTQPIIADFIDSRDHTFVRKELSSFTEAIDYSLINAFWINKIGANIKSELKPLQLSLAIKNLLPVPKTLVSNDPLKIRKFLSGKGPFIYKPLNGHFWNENNKALATYTAEISNKILPGDDVIKAAPGIYQRKIIKLFEVRAQFFGDHCVAVKIDPETLQCGHLDWRLDQHSISNCESLSLPTNIYQACRSLMRDLDIVSGAFDFIVDKSGKWYFLEVNQSGQFLFMEQWCDDLFLIDAFCQFIENASDAFCYVRPDNPLTLKTINASMMESA